MTSTPTCTNRRNRRFYYFFFTLVLLPFAAQSQNNTTELEQRMNTLYAQARDLRADLPVRDYRGNSSI